MPECTNDLHGRKALVTGSSRGIGASIARLFAERGAAVVVHGRDAGATGRVTAQIDQAGGQALAVVADLTRPEEVEAMRDTIEERRGPLDILVANAGGNPVHPGPLEAIDEAGWRASLDSNLTATFLTIKAFRPGMKERQHGSVLV
jgi:3-oxoacyl-[acyl-carrier protein] reductase